MGRGIKLSYRSDEDHAVQTVDVESSSFESNEADDLGLDVVENDKSVA